MKAPQLATPTPFPGADAQPAQLSAARALKVFDPDNPKEMEALALFEAHQLNPRLIELAREIPRETSRIAMLMAIAERRREIHGRFDGPSRELWSEVTAFLEKAAPETRAAVLGKLLLMDRQGEMTRALETGIYNRRGAQGVDEVCYRAIQRCLAAGREDQARSIYDRMISDQKRALVRHDFPVLRSSS